MNSLIIDRMKLLKENSVYNCYLLPILREGFISTEIILFVQKAKKNSKSIDFKLLLLL